MADVDVWENWFSDYAARTRPELEAFFEKHPEAMKHLTVWITTRPEVPPVAVEYYLRGNPDDLEWLSSALRDNRKRWFVANLALRAGTVPEPLFEPMLMAAVHAREPSFGPRFFVAPCSRVFGSGRVIEYLVSVAEGSLNPEAVLGALEAMYPSKDAQQILERRKTFLLEAFVADDASKYFRGRIPVWLRFDPREFPETHTELVARAREIEARQNSRIEEHD